VKILPPGIRDLLHEPLGPVYSEKDVLAKLKHRHGLLVSVGDTISYVLLVNKVEPEIFFYDLKNLRRPVSPQVKELLEKHAKRLLVVKNPAGGITGELEAAVAKVLKNKRGRVFVDGEEDLATLVVLALAPVGTVVLYGQPEKGVVLLTVDEEWKLRAKDLLEAMEVVE